MNAPIRRSGFIRELCDAVAHRWQPDRIFVVLTLTTYLDESGTHDGSTVTIMAGVMATARQWANFEAEFAKLQGKYGFKTFHTKKFKRRKGDFKGWSPIKQLALLTDIAALSENAFIESTTITLDNADYRASYKSGDKPRRLRLESEYGFCFRNLLMFFALEGIKWTHGNLPKLHFVLENGHRNWSEVRDIFREVKSELRGLDRDLLGEVTFADKSDCTPLMIADFLAHITFMRRDETPSPGDPGTPVTEAVLLPRQEPGVTHLRFKPGGLAELKTDLVEKIKATRSSSARGSEGQSS